MLFSEPTSSHLNNPHEPWHHISCELLLLSIFSSALLTFCLELFINSFCWLIHRGFDLQVLHFSLVYKQDLPGLIHWRIHYADVDLSLHLWLSNSGSNKSSDSYNPDSVLEIKIFSVTKIQIPKTIWVRVRQWQHVTGQQRTLRSYIIELHYLSQTENCGERDIHRKKGVLWLVGTYSNELQTNKTQK